MEESSATESWRAELIAGLHALREGHFSQAETHFDRAYRAAPERAEVSFALGRERLRRGNAAEAEELLWAAWRTDPSLLSAGATLARCLGLHRGRNAEAHAVLDEAEAHHGRQPALDVTRAELFAHAKDWERAEQCARRGLATTESEGEKDPTRLAAAAVLARVDNERGVDLARAGDHEAALFAFKRASDLDPAWGAPHLNTGAAFAALGRRRAARTAYERAIAVDPTNAIAHYNLGLLLLDCGLTNEAVARLDTARQFEPADPAIAAGADDARSRLRRESPPRRDGDE